LDYVSTVLTSTLDNLKSSFTKRVLGKLPSKLRKGGHLKWFPHFSRKHKKVYFLRYANSKVLNVKASQLQWSQLLNTPRPVLHFTPSAKANRYSKTLGASKPTPKQTQQLLTTKQVGFSKWGSRIKRKRRPKSATKKQTYPTRLNALHLDGVFTKSISYSRNHPSSMKSPTTNIKLINKHLLFLRYILNRKKKTLVRRLVMPKIKTARFRLRSTRSLHTAPRKIRPQLKGRKYVRKWLFTNKTFNLLTRIKRSTNKQKKKTPRNQNLKTPLSLNFSKHHRSCRTRNQNLPQISILSVLKCQPSYCQRPHQA